MTLLNNMVDQGDSIFYTKKYRQMIEDHIPYLKLNRNLTTITLAPLVSFKYAADFYGLLFHLLIPMEYHYMVLRLNNFKSPSDFTGTESSIKMLETDIIRKLVNTMKTQIKKK